MNSSSFGSSKKFGVYPKTIGVQIWGLQRKLQSILGASNYLKKRTRNEEIRRKKSDFLILVETILMVKRWK